MSELPLDNANRRALSKEYGQAMTEYTVLLLVGMGMFGFVGCIIWALFH